MKLENEILTIADTIIWLATERQKREETRCQNLNSAIHSVAVEVSEALMEVMKENK